MSGARPGEKMRKETDFTVLEREASGLVSVTAKVIDHDIEQARVCGAFIHEARVAHGRQVVVLVDMRAARSLTREARLFYQSQEIAADVAATALLVDSGVSRVIGNFIVGLNRTMRHMRLFSDLDEARAWLESQTHE